VRHIPDKSSSGGPNAKVYQAARHVQGYLLIPGKSSRKSGTSRWLIESQ